MRAHSQSGEGRSTLQYESELEMSCFDNVEYKIVEQVVTISPELIYDCKIQNSMNENEMNF